jgi:hypothetical protein
MNQSQFIPDPLSFGASGGVKDGAGGEYRELSYGSGDLGAAASSFIMLPPQPAHLPRFLACKVQYSHAPLPQERHLKAAAVLGWFTHVIMSTLLLQ